VHHWNQNNQVREHVSQQTQVSEPIQPAVVPPPGFSIPAHAPPEVVEHQQQLSKQAQSHFPEVTSELNRQLKQANKDLKNHLQNVNQSLKLLLRLLKNLNMILYNFKQPRKL
jgi:hypothetical protein